MKRLLLALILFTSGECLLMAANQATRIYAVGIADPEELLERAKAIGSGESKIWLNPQQTLLNVVDTPDRQAQVAALVQSLQRPSRQISLRIRYPDFAGPQPGTGSGMGLSTGDRTGLTGMRHSPFGGGKIRFGDPAPPRDRTASPQPVENVTVVTVSRGKGAWLMISPDPPQGNWLFQWGLEKQYWAPSPRWTQVKAYLFVEAKVRDDKIRLRLLPALSYTVGATQRNVAIDVEGAEATIASGDELETSRVFSSTNTQFQERFFQCYDLTRQARPMHLWITPVLQ